MLLHESKETLTDPKIIMSSLRRTLYKGLLSEVITLAPHPRRLLLNLVIVSVLPLELC